MDKFTREGHEEVRYFVGGEVEHTPAFGKRTLFVVGLQRTSSVKLMAEQNKTPHIFLSANRSFDSVELRNGVYMVGDNLASQWEQQIRELLDSGYMVSLDYPAHKHVDVLKILGPGIWQCRNFVPILSVQVPNVTTTSPNLTVKIDDINFRATNPGVWCMNYKEVTDSNRFTDWQDYGTDEILPNPVEILPLRVPTVNDVPTSYIEVSIPEVIYNDPSTPMPPYHALPVGPAPAVDIKNLKIMTDTKNDPELGLDPDSVSKLKPSPDEVFIPGNLNVTPEIAAAAYADGTTDDPLRKDESKKPRKVK